MSATRASLVLVEERWGSVVTEAEEDEFGRDGGKRRTDG